MKWLVPIVSLTMTLNSRALITNTMVADWQGGVGVTSSGGRISQWNDQHLLLNNDGRGPHNLTQSNGTSAPYDVTDAHGYHGVLFPWDFSSAHPQNFLNIPASLSGLNTTNLTVYVVATGPVAQDEKQTLIAFTGLPSSWIKFYLTGAYPAYFPACMFVGTTSSTIYPPINRSVFVASSDPARTTLRWNYVTQTNAPQGQAFSSGGGTIGAVNSGEYFSGIIYRVLVYSNAHTAAQMDAQVSELSKAYGVPTNFTKQAVCRGASSVEGVGSTMLQSWPFQLWQRYPEIAWHNQGIGGEKIGPSSNVDTMINQDFNFVDPLYDPKLERNWLLFYAGINDINSDGISGVDCYGRLTNYVAARKVAHPWTVIVGTITPSIQDQVRKGEFNFCIRTNVGNYEGYVDPGYLSPVETRLNDYTDLTYYTSDGLHLNNTGYSVIADHFGAIVNVPHRTTGNFGP